MTENGTTQDDAAEAPTDEDSTHSNQVTFGTVTTTTMGEEASPEDVLTPLPGIEADTNQNGGDGIHINTTTEDNSNHSTPFSRPALVREERVPRLDISTGMATRRQQSIREVNASKPSNRWNKMAARLQELRVVEQASEELEAAAAQAQQENNDGNAGDDGDENHGKTKRKQYRIRSKTITEGGKLSLDLAYEQRPAQVAITEYLHVSIGCCLFVDFRALLIGIFSHILTFCSCSGPSRPRLGKLF
jgi:hypothetical protein